MNDYRIIYSTAEGNAQETITERSEAAARKFFKARHKDAEISDVELVNVDVNATKAQERETLEKIKTMVAELGPQSYLKTAFEGVFEVAEEQLKEMGSKYNAARSDVEVLRSQLDHAQEQADALKKQQLPVWLHSAVYGLASAELTTSKTRMEQAAETMAYYAEAPQDIAFAEAVKGYRAAKERREVCEQIVKGLEALTEE